MNRLDERLRALRDLEPRPPADLAALRSRTARRRSRRVAAGAAVAAVVVLGAIGLWPGGDDNAQLEVVDDPTTTDPTTTAPTSTTTTSRPVGYGDIQPPPPTSEPPERFVAVTVDGRLVVVDTATGRETAQLASAGDPTAPPPQEGPGPNVIDDVALSPDGSTVWYSTCCEPAGGSLFRVPTDGSAEPTRVADGYDPALPGTGRWVAAVSIYGALVVDADGGPNRIWSHDEFSGMYQETAWSLDGERLVVRTGTPDAGELLVIDPATFPAAEEGASRDGEPPLTRLDGDWRAPVFVRDGQILAARRSDGNWSPALVDPDSGDVTAAPFDYELPVPLEHDVDPTGEWVLVVEAADDTAGAGTARWIGPDGSSQPIGGTYRTVSW